MDLALPATRGRRHVLGREINLARDASRRRLALALRAVRLRIGPALELTTRGRERLLGRGSGVVRRKAAGLRPGIL